MTKSTCEKKNPCDLSYQQKSLLKVLSCLYKQYVIGSLNNTNAFLANPDATSYALMKSELYLLQTTIQSNLPPSLVCSATTGNTLFAPLARLVAWDAAGLVACDTQYDVATPAQVTEDLNTFSNYDTSSGAGNLISGLNRRNNSQSQIG